MIILDTHAALWWWLDSPRLSRPAREMIRVNRDSVHVSVVSALEVANKNRIGKLNEIGDPAERFPALMAANRFISLPLSQQQALLAGLLPGDHRDPFDRLIAAQALDLDYMILTCDPVFIDFGCKVLW